MTRMLDAYYEDKWFGGVPVDYSVYQNRAAFIDPLLTQWGVSKTNGKILVVGSAWGHLLTAIRERGWMDVWGVDSQYAKLRSDQVTQIQQVRDRIGVCDATNATALRSFKMGTAGMGQNTRFAACITEDVMSTLSGGAEVTALLSALRTHVTLDRNIHFITMYEPGQSWSSVMTTTELADGYYQSPAAWQAAINGGGRTDTIYNLRTIPQVI
jgi:hypothetical protein